MIAKNGCYWSPDGFHRHKCPACDHVWEHSDHCHGITSEHLCPECGEEQVVKYSGPDAPSMIVSVDR